MNAFTIEALLKLNKSGYESGMDEAESRGKGFASKVGSSFISLGGTVAKGIAASAAAAAAGIAKLSASSLSAAGELEQGLGGLEAVFGAENFDKMVTKSKEAYAQMGLSQQEYLEHANKMGSLFQGSGMGEEEAMEKTVSMMQRASDVASIMGIDVESAMQAIEGAAKGNYTMMDNLGVAMNETTLAAYAESKGINKAWSEMSQLEKEQIAYQMFMEKTEKYAGNYAKENETYAGSINTMKAAWKNFLSDPSVASAEAFTNSISNAADVIVGSAEKILPNLIEGAGTVIQKLGAKIPWILERIAPMVADGVDMVFSMLPGLVSGLLPVVVEWVNKIVKKLPSILKTVVPVVMDMLGSIADVLPEIIPDIVDAMIETAPIVWNGLKTLVMKLVPALIQTVKSVAPRIWGALKNGLSSGFSLAKNWFGEKVLPKWNEIKSSISNWWGGVKEKVAGICTIVSEWVGEKASKVTTAVTAWWGGVKEKVAGVCTIVSEWVGEKVNNVTTAVTTWWSGVKEKAAEICTVVSNWAGEKASVVGEAIKKWWSGEDGNGGVYGSIKDFLTATFGIDMPEWSEVVGKISGFWETVKTGIADTFKMLFDVEMPLPSKIIGLISGVWEKVYGVVKYLFKMAFNIELPTWEELGEKISNGWNNVVWPKIQDFFQTTFGVKLPDWGKLINDIKEGWDNVKKSVGDFVMNIQLPEWLKTVLKTLGIKTGDTLGSIGSSGYVEYDSPIGPMPEGSSNPYGYEEEDPSSTHSGGTKGGASFRIDGNAGLADKYAELSNGINTANANSVKLLQNGKAATAAEIGSAVKNAMSSVGIYMDGTLVGKIVAPTVSSLIVRGV